jgi:hypothetical protein
MRDARPPDWRRRQDMILTRLNGVINDAVTALTAPCDDNYLRSLVVHTYKAWRHIHFTGEQEYTENTLKGKNPIY